MSIAMPTVITNNHLPQNKLDVVANAANGEFNVVDKLKSAFMSLVSLFWSDTFASLFKFNDKVFSLPIIEGTEGEKAINVDGLRKTTSDESEGQNPFVAYSPNARDVATTASEITFINGEEGILRHRGYPIEQLAEKSSFAEVAHLLINKELPKSQQSLADFEKQIVAAMKLPDEIKTMLQNYPADKVHPMNALSGAIAALEDRTKRDSRKLSAENAIDIMGKTLAITAFLIRKYKEPNQTVTLPELNTSLDAVDNFIQMIFGEQEKSTPAYGNLKKAFNQLLILHADHEQNCSAFTARVVASGDAGPYAAVSAAVNALYGPLHGGANQQVLEHLTKINALERDDVQAKVKSVVEAINADSKAKKANQPMTHFKTLLNVSDDKLSGWGHAVYKSKDPRAEFIKQACATLIPALEQGGKLDPETKDFYEMAKQLEVAARDNEYFQARDLYPNVDFYSGILYKALGIPTELFTVMFAAGRTPGWLAQIMEQKARPDTQQIVRPRQVYVGHTVRDYTAAA